MLKFDDFEILEAGSNVMWVPRHGGDRLPEGAFVAGQKSNNQKLYLGRCYTEHNSLTPGKIDEYFYYSFGEKEHKDCVNHEVLVC